MPRLSTGSVQVETDDLGDIVTESPRTLHLPLQVKPGNCQSSRTTMHLIWEGEGQTLISQSELSDLYFTPIINHLPPTDMSPPSGNPYPTLPPHLFKPEPDLDLYSHLQADPITPIDPTVPSDVETSQSFGVAALQDHQTIGPGTSLQTHQLALCEPCVTPSLSDSSPPFPLTPSESLVLASNLLPTGESGLFLDCTQPDLFIKNESLHLPQGETNQLSPSNSVSANETGLFLSTPSLSSDEHWQEEGSFLAIESDHFFLSDFFMAAEKDPPESESPEEVTLHYKIDLLNHPGSVVLDQSEQLFQDKSFTNSDQPPQSEYTLATKREEFLQTESSIHLESDQLQFENSLISGSEQMSMSSSIFTSNTDQIQPFNTSSPTKMKHQPLCGSPIECDHLNSPNTSLICEKSLLPWDWTLQNDDDCAHSGSESFRTFNEIEDTFSIFQLDTPPDSDQHLAVDHLTLSHDLLSLSEVFTHMEVPSVQKDYDHSIDQWDQLPLFKGDLFCNKEQLPNGKINNLHFSQPNSVLLPKVSGQIPCSQTDISNGNGQQPFSGITEELNPKQSDLFEIEQPSPNILCPLPENSNDWTDLSQFYYLDLLFDTDTFSCERNSLTPNHTPKLPHKLDVAHDSSLLPLDNSSGQSSSSDIMESLLQCLPNSYMETQKSLSVTVSPVETAPLLESDQQVFVNSAFLECIEEESSVGSSNETNCSQEKLTIETNSLPLIIITDPMTQSDSTEEHQSDIKDSFLKSIEALPIETLQLPQFQIDPPLKASQVSSCNRVTEQLPLSQLDIPLENIQLPVLETSSSVLNDRSQMPLSRTAEISEDIKLTLTPSCENPLLENVQLPPCTVTDTICSVTNSQDIASVTSTESENIFGLSLETEPSGHGDELARLRAVFDALDRDKDGFVKMEDFVQFATVYGAEQVKYLTGYLDPAGLGVINFRDFYRGISEIQNEDLDMQLYDMGYPSEEEPACSVDFDDIAAFEVTEVTDSAYVGSESAYSECETFTDEDTGVLATQEDQESEVVGGVSRLPQPATPEGLELSLCDISVVTVTSHEEQFEDFGEGAEPDLFDTHEGDDNFTPSPDVTNRLSPSPDKRPSSRKEARRLQHSSFLEEESTEQQVLNMACDEPDLTDKVLYLEQRVSELERDAATTAEQQNRLRQENLQLLHRAHALEEQLKDQELLSDEVQCEETRKHRDEMRKMERDNGYQLSSLKARMQELENENSELRSQVPDIKATVQRLEEEKQKLLDEVESLQNQVKDNIELNQKLSGQLSKEKHNQQSQMERCQEVIEELRRELEQMQLVKLDMEHRLGLGNSAALQEYNSRTREAELEQEVRRLKQEQRALKEQNEELNGQIINLSIQGAKNLFSTTFSDSLAAEISNVSRDELMEAIQKQEEINLRLQDYIDRIIVAIMETNPAILEVKMH
ncbi:hypothetical protein GDO86_017487 [Hymenochirus boettgeri]|uniref:Rab11 family-interacting protein 3 n=1 Tax=Hymenochirus boettgeri TaxID=247094 RepID=A0A8T2IQ66_9PIPI|nr:hypothetical protein GDO86_017487 [Hymenochirus boettgeri]